MSPQVDQGAHPREPLRRRAIRLGKRTIAALAVAVLLTWLLALTLSFTIDPRRGTPRHREDWHQPASLAQTQLWESAVSLYAETTWRYGLKRPWGTEQAAGPPDTASTGDIQTAWASATQDGQREWLTLRWSRPVMATGIVIHQTHNPGAIDSIVTGAPAQTLWAGLPESTRNWAVPVSPARSLDSITLHIDSATVGGWNEIDAVGLIDESGKSIYADVALASSTYADRSGGATVELPAWCTPVFAMGSDGSLLTERRATAAFGWPFPAWIAARTLDSLPSVTAPTPSRVISGPQSGPISALPYRPLWHGLILNTLVYAAMIGALAFIFLHPIRPVRRMFRMQRGCCPGCGYDLRFNFAAGCSECGFLKPPAPAIAESPPGADCP